MIKRTDLKRLGEGPKGFASFANFVPSGSAKETRPTSNRIAPRIQLIAFNSLIIVETRITCVFGPLHLVFLFH